MGLSTERKADLKSRFPSFADGSRHRNHLLQSQNVCLSQGSENSGEIPVDVVQRQLLWHIISRLLPTIFHSRRAASNKRFNRPFETMESADLHNANSSSEPDTTMIRRADMRAIDGIISSDKMGAAVRALAQLRMTGQQLLEYLKQPRKLSSSLALPAINLTFRCSTRNP